ncbi:MAG: hypothetical protein ACM3PC_10945, partial [Deltaproteobacteria bacterium]
MDTHSPGVLLLDLRPVQREHFWAAWVRRPAALPGGSALPLIRRASRTGLQKVRNQTRIVRESLRNTVQAPLFRFLSRVLSLQQRIEASFQASGAATQLADAALEGETTRQLAERIARIARRLSGAAGAAVHLRT